MEIRSCFGVATHTTWRNTARPKSQEPRSGKFTTMDDQALIQAIQQRRCEINNANIKTAIAVDKVHVLGIELDKANTTVHKLSAAMKLGKSTLSRVNKLRESGNAKISELGARVTELEFNLQHAKKDEERAVQEVITKHSEEVQQLKSEHAVAIEKLNEEHKAELERVNTQVQDARKETETAKGGVQTATHDMGLAGQSGRIAESEQQALAAHTIASDASRAPEAGLQDAAHSVKEQQARINFLERQLRLHIEETTNLKEEIEKGNKAYDELKQANRAQILDSRTVSSDLMHSYLRTSYLNTKKNWIKIPTIHLRDHDWVLSEIGDLPSNMSRQEDSERLQTGAEGEHARLETPASSAPSSDRAHIPQLPDNEASITTTKRPDTSSQDPRKSKSRKPVCSQCWRQDKACSGDVLCRQCEVAGEACIYRRCGLGANCPWPRCGTVHPGQETVGGEHRKIDFGGKAPQRKRKRND